MQRGVASLKHADAMRAPALQKCCDVGLFGQMPRCVNARQQAARRRKRKQTEQVLNLTLGRQRQAGNRTDHVFDRGSLVGWCDQTGILQYHRNNT